MAMRRRITVSWESWQKTHLVGHGTVATVATVAAAFAIGVFACGNSDAGNDTPGTSNDAGGAGEGAPQQEAAAAADTSMVSPPGDGGPNVGPGVGQLDGAPPTALPPLPQLTNVIAIERDDSVGVDFDRWTTPSTTACTRSRTMATSR